MRGMSMNMFEFYEEDLPFDDFPTDEEPRKKPQLYRSETVSAKYLSAQDIGRWKHHWQGFKLKKDRDEWDKMDSLYLFETIKKKIDYFVSRGAAPRYIAGNVVKSVTQNCKEDKPQPRLHVDNRPTARKAENMPAPSFGFKP